MKREIVLIAHNLRSCHNVGSLLRTADGLGVSKVYLSGYSPYPAMKDDARLPHLAKKVNAQIAKTALGAEKTVNWELSADVSKAFEKLRKDGFEIVALEQTDQSINIADYKPSDKVALIVGREVEGIEPEILELTDKIIEIPMRGTKESFNVSIAGAIGLFKLISE